MVYLLLQMLSINVKFSTDSGNAFIFSDSPEEVKLKDNNQLIYMWGTSLGSDFKDVEMYHHVLKGDATGTMRFGVAIWNAGTSATTITYKQNGVIQDGYISGNQFMQPIANQLCQFFSSRTAEQILYPNSISFFTYDTTMDYNKSIWYRGQFKSSNSSDVWIRVFIAGNNKINSGAELFDINEPEVATEPEFFTGEIAYTQKIPTRAISSNGTYKIFGIKKRNNVNEYGTVNAYKVNGNKFLDGNYGVIYKYTISDGEGKTAKIIPIYENSRTHASIVYRVNGGLWQYAYLEKSQFPFRIYIPSNPTILEMALPGGNCSNMIMKFE